MVGQKNWPTSSGESKKLTDLLWSVKKSDRPFGVGKKIDRPFGVGQKIYGPLGVGKNRIHGEQHDNFQWVFQQNW